MGIVSKGRKSCQLERHERKEDESTKLLFSQGGRKESMRSKVQCIEWANEILNKVAFSISHI